MKEWINVQFTRERTNRYLDGSNPNHLGGNGSFVQVVTYRWPIELWSVVNVSTPSGKRDTYYLKGIFGTSKNGYSIELCMWSHASGTTKSLVVFEPRENAPKKLNKEIRMMRKELGI